MRPEGERPLLEVAALFLRLGFIAFGGPAAHIALMREEVVRRRHWLDDQRFMDLFGMSSIIPGPTSTEMTIHIGCVRAGWRGLVVAGSCFILPATCIVLALAWAYATFGSTPAVSWLLYGIKPAIIAIIAQAIWNLRKSAMKNWFLAAVGLAVLALSLLGVDVLLLLFGAGLLVMLAVNARRLQASGSAVGLAPLRMLRMLRMPARWPLREAGSLALAAGAAVPVSLPLIFLLFLKIGAVLFGGGYVLLAFLRADFVENLHWLTDQQLIDAIAVGQFTPGPVFTTATFVGYLLAGVPGAVLATLGIFLPAFILVALSIPLLPHIRKSPWTAALLDGVNVASLGLMTAVTAQIAQAALIDALTVGLALASAILLFRTKINSTWLIIGSGAIGLAYRALAG